MNQRPPPKSIQFRSPSQFSSRQPILRHHLRRAILRREVARPPLLKIRFAVTVVQSQHGPPVTVFCHCDPFVFAEVEQINLAPWPSAVCEGLAVAAFRANLTSDVVHAEGLAAPMTALRDFIDEIASELDARTDKPLAPHHWIRFVKLLGAIDREEEMGELRQQMEQIVSQRHVRFQDRCLELIPLLNADFANTAAFTARRRAAITALAAL